MTHPGIAVMLVVGVGLGAVLYYFFSAETNSALGSGRQRSGPQANRTYWPAAPPDVRNRRQEQKCTICLEDTNKEDDVLIIPCKHVFHKQCIEEWRRNGQGQARQRCPVCRDKIESLEKL